MLDIFKRFCMYFRVCFLILNLESNEIPHYTRGCSFGGFCNHPYMLQRTSYVPFFL